MKTKRGFYILTLSAFIGAALTPRDALAQNLSDSKDSDAMPVDGSLDSDEQLAGDLTPIPTGMGAILVPTLTDPADEPEVIVYRRGERLATGSTGSRIALPPGTYRIVLGSAARKLADSLPQTEVRVLTGKTTTVKPFFGAVRVNLVNSDGEASDGTYVIRSVGSGAVYGPTHMPTDADEKAAPTWLLPPGRYQIVAGSSANASEGSSAIEISPGQILKYRMVLEDGRLLRTEFGDDPIRKTKSIWRARWTLGASGSLSRQVGTFTGVQGNSLFAQVFSQFEGGINTHMHDAALRLNVNQSFIGVDADGGRGVPVRALTNEIEAELLYNLRLGGIVGPYVRGLGRTSLFKTEYTPEVDVIASTYDDNNKLVRRETYKANSDHTLLDNLAPFTLQEGAGLGITLLDNDHFDLKVRGGVAARQAYYGSGSYIERRDGNQLRLKRLDRRENFGGELTAIGAVRVSRFAAVETRFEAYMPQDQVFDGASLAPVFRWDTNVVLKISPAIAATYTLSVRRDEVVIPNIQTAQLLALRFQYSVF